MCETNCRNHLNILILINVFNTINNIWTLQNSAKLRVHYMRHLSPSSSSCNGNFEDDTELQNYNTKYLIDGEIAAIVWQQICYMKRFFEHLRIISNVSNQRKRLGRGQVKDVKIGYLSLETIPRPVFTRWMYSSDFATKQTLPMELTSHLWTPERWIFRWHTCITFLYINLRLNCHSL